MKPPLHIVTDADTAPAKTETMGELIRRLQAESKALANAHVRSVLDNLARIAAALREIETGGDAYPNGARQEFAAMARTIETHVKTVEQIVSKAS